MMAKHVKVNREDYERLLGYLSKPRDRAECVRHLQLSGSTLYYMLNYLEAKNIVKVEQGVFGNVSNKKFYSLHPAVTDHMIAEVLGEQKKGKVYHVTANKDKATKVDMKGKSFAELKKEQQSKIIERPRAGVMVVRGLDGYHTKSNNRDRKPASITGGSLNTTIWG